MSTETLKISLAQKILGLSNDSLLKKIKAIIEKENIIGYVNGKPITESQYISEMDSINTEIDNVTANLLTTSEVKNNILNENNLAQ